MLECNYKGGLFEGLNTIMRVSNEIEAQEPYAMYEQVPYGVKQCDDCGLSVSECACSYCDGCGRDGDCACENGCNCGSRQCKGSAGSQPADQVAILGSEYSDEVGEMSVAQIVQESMVSQVQSIIKSNLDACGQKLHDPLSFFKEPIKVDSYSPIVKYGDEMIK